MLTMVLSHLTCFNFLCIQWWHNPIRQNGMVLTSSVMGDCCSLGWVGVGRGWAWLRRVADWGDRIWESQWGHFTTDLFWPSLTTLLVSNILQRNVLHTLECHTIYDLITNVILLLMYVCDMFYFWNVICTQINKSPRIEALTRCLR